MLKKQGSCDKLNYYVFETRAEMGARAAKDIADAMRRVLAEKEQLNMIFAAAPSQNETLAALTANRELAWDRVNAFHMDEYIGLAPDAPQRFGNFLKEAVFDKVPFRSVHYINGGAEDIQAECERYSGLLDEYPVDIVCLGIGENGHIAFNDPPVADFNDAALVKRVLLDETCRKQQVHDGCFATLDEVPAAALTLTVPALVRADYMFCTVPGETKRAAVKAVMNDEISERCPATILRRHSSAVMYCDAQSGADLV